MGLTSSLFAGLSGMKTNEFRMDVVGNNIANVNTTAFKSSRATFQSQFYSTFNFGSAPNGPVGGANPMQVGTGSMVGAVTRDFSGGSPETTGVKTDLAIQGQGMFILNRSDGAQVYTRDGSFQFNAENYLLSSDGYFLQGYGVDANYNVVEGTLTDLRIPLGEITTAATTNNVAFSGDLNAEGLSAIDPISGEANGQVRTILDTANGSQVLTSASGPLTGGDLLTTLEVDGVAIFAVGNEIVLNEAIKGGQTLPQASLEVTATTTVDDYLAWIEDVLGIFNSTDYDLSSLDFTGGTPPLDISNPGVRINTAGDGIEIVGNVGTYNLLELGRQAIQVQTGTGVTPPVGQPFNFQVPSGFSQADIESIRTSFRAYDSLGIPMDIDVTIVMESKSGTGITWRFFAESSDNVTGGRTLGTGTISFDTEGNYLEGTGLTVSIDRSGTGANTPQSITLDFSTMDGYAMERSAISMLGQDGFPAGTLQDFSIGSDGIIVGSFTNGLTRQLGQVVLTTFRNYGGLIAEADNLYITGPNSGNPIVKKPQELGAGSINSAALELSNVDLSREFINLIISSTGFSASSRVIQTSDQLLNELIAMTR
ncbi:MAG: flagellar hook-basal body complex protein [Sedimentisphaerales bacterium]|nr:flagellar hook-basal body complex protein [Sedimentisphaerales bacterium]